MVSERPPFPVQPEVMAVLETLWPAGHAAYLVGGGVRDGLLGLPSDDWDVATDARPERILELFPGSSYENRFGTVRVGGAEITTFRRDHRYADHRRPERVTFSDDIYEDLARRDLTINAIAWGQRGPDAPARLVDPADGQGDLEARLVRAVGDPARRFDEDALRLLRAVRIAAHLDFAIEPVTFAAMRSHAPDIAWVSGERIAAEARRMLAGTHPSQAFRLLLETGILERAFPELHQLATHPAGRDGRSLLDRSLRALDVAAAEAPGQERVRIAALVARMDAPAARLSCGRLFISARETEGVAAIHAAANADATGWSDAQVRRFMRSVAPELLDDVLLVRRWLALAADDPEALEQEAHLRERVAGQRAANVPLTLADLAISGRDLRDSLGVPEGPVIGRTLARLLDDVIEEPSLNERMTLLRRANLALHEPGSIGADPSAPGTSARLGR